MQYNYTFSRMRRIFLLAAIAIGSMTFAQAQQETLFSKIRHVGGFGGPMIEVSQIDGQTVADVGGGGALILDNFFFGGYGLGTDAPNIVIDEVTYDIDFGHGGLWFGYVLKSHKLAHLYTSLKMGWGGANLNDGSGDKVFSDNVFVLEPEAGVEVNLTSWFRLALTGGYRSVSGVNTLAGGLTNDSFSGVYGALTFRFGGFGDYDKMDDEISIEF